MRQLNGKTTSILALSTDVGDFPCPDDIRVLYEASQLRRDRQPDRRTRAGRLWWKLFREFQQQKIAEYRAA